MNLNLHDIVTPAGIIALGLIIRQLVEVLKGLAPTRWIDYGNERKVSIILAAVAYVAWFLAYGTSLATDGFTALTAFIAVALAAMGANSAIDAAQQTLATTLVKQSPALQTPALPPLTPVVNAVYEAPGQPMVANASDDLDDDGIDDAKEPVELPPDEADVIDLPDDGEVADASTEPQEAPANPDGVPGKLTTDAEDAAATEALPAEAEAVGTDQGTGPS